MPYKLLPGLLWLQGYTAHTLRQDVVSGLVIGVMLIPQSMGYAVLAGLPPEFGLYASIFPPLLYALLGTSNKISIGPVALDAILILSGLSVLAEPGSDHYLQLAIELTLLVGLIQFVFGLLRFGFIVNFLSYPVVVGYTSAASIIIIGSQLQSLTGVHVDSANVLDLAYQLLINIGNWHGVTMGIAIASLLFIFLCKRHTPKLPNALILLVGTMLLSGLFHAGQAGVDVINSVPAGFPALQIPDIDFARLGDLLPVAFTVALMGFVGTMSICKSQESPKDKRSVQPNQELIALGLANALGAMFRSFPVSASFSRSAARFRCADPSVGNHFLRSDRHHGGLSYAVVYRLSPTQSRPVSHYRDVGTGVAQIQRNENSVPAGPKGISDSVGHVCDHTAAGCSAGIIGGCCGIADAGYLQQYYAAHD